MDVKPLNVGLFMSGSWGVLDMDSALPLGQVPKEFAVTEAYIAPEMAAGIMAGNLIATTAAMDVYAAGLVLLDMLTPYEGGQPFEAVFEEYEERQQELEEAGSNYMDEYYTHLIEQGDATVQLRLAMVEDPAAKDLANCMLSNQEAGRISLASALQHAFLQQEGACVTAKGSGSTPRRSMLRSRRASMHAQARVNAKYAVTTEPTLSHEDTVENTPQPATLSACCLVS